MKKTNKILAALVLGSLMAGNAVFAEGDNVQYKDSSKELISLSENGTVIDNLKTTGNVFEGSKQAVSGNEVYDMQSRYDHINESFTVQISNILKTESSFLKEIYGYKDSTTGESFQGIKPMAQLAYNNVKDGYWIGVNGKRLINLYTGNKDLDFTTGDNISIEQKGEDGLKISVKANGVVEAGNNGLVTGGMVKDAINKATEGIATDVNVANKADKDLSNLTAGAEQKISKLATNAAASTMIGKADTDAGNINTEAWQEKLAASAIEENDSGFVTSDLMYSALKTFDSEYAYADAKNLSSANVSAWQKTLGNGVNEAGNAGLITGDTLNKALSGLSYTGGKTYTGSDTVSISDAGEISVKANGKVEAKNGGLVTGGQVQEAISKATEGFTTDANVANKMDKNLGNISDEGKTAIKDIVKDDLASKVDKNDIYSKTELDNKFDAKVSKDEFKTVSDKVDANTKALEGKADTSYVDAGLAKKADADKVYTKEETNQKISDALTGVTGSLDKKANADLDNITEKGKTAIKDVMKDDLAKKADTSAVEAVNAKADANTKALEGKAAVDASNIDAGKYAEKLGTGTVARDDKNLVNGGTVFNAINQLKEETGTGLVTVSDGTVTVAKDSDATKVSIAGAKGSRVLTGVETDAEDATSAANVGYVNAQTQTLGQAMESMNNKLTDDIKNVGAVSAALAGLHHLDYDPDNKLDVAAAMGHYRGKSAAALGLFYQPNENVMLSAGATIGGDDNAYNAGVSFKVGKGSSYANTSKAAMAAEIKQLKADKEEQASELKDQAAQIKELKDQVALLLQKMELSDTVTKSIVK